jgi:hypothetical protein
VHEVYFFSLRHFGNHGRIAEQRFVIVVEVDVYHNFFISIHRYLLFIVLPVRFRLLLTATPKIKKAGTHPQVVRVPAYTLAAVLRLLFVCQVYILLYNCNNKTYTDIYLFHKNDRAGKLPDVFSVIPCSSVVM